MKNYLLFIVIFILLIVLAVQPFDIIINIVIAIFEFGLILYILIKNNDNYKSNETQIRQSECNKMITSIVRKNWHDLLNCVQVISCYATLGKNKEIIDYISYINYLSKQNKLMSSFSDDDLVIYLYRLTVGYPDLVIEIEIEEEIAELKEKIDGKWVLETLKDFIDAINLAINKNMETSLLLSIGSTEEEFIINLELEGNINHMRNKINSLGKRLISQDGDFNIDLDSEENCILVLYFPLKNIEVSECL